jgi:hypothetical protein
MNSYKNLSTTIGDPTKEKGQARGLALTPHIQCYNGPSAEKTEQMKG